MKYKKDEIYDLEGERVKVLDFLENFVHYEVLENGERFYCGYGYWEKSAKHIVVKMQDVEVKDMVNHPSHYNKGKYECLEVVKELVKDMEGEEAILFFNTFKYLWRYKFKNGIEDLKKCEFYLKELIFMNEIP